MLIDTGCFSLSSANDDLASNEAFDSDGVSGDPDYIQSPSHEGTDDANSDM